MGMSGMYGASDERESIATIHAALDAGIDLLDTGDFYGMGHNELLLGRALAGRDRSSYLLSSSARNATSAARGSGSTRAPRRQRRRSRTAWGGWARRTSTFTGRRASIRTFRSKKRPERLPK
jgi:aryl-alcohol dehydrogenase-like predicted oxidoreductase